MANYTVEGILSNLNEQEILTRGDYTFVEYVEQLIKFQEISARYIIGDEKAELVRMNEVVSRCEAMAREKNLYCNKKVVDGIRALKTISKEIAIAMAGKRGEDRVANTFQYVTRPDARFFRNVFLTDGVEETELDTVVLTKNGFIILEIKNAKEDITIAQDGRILFNNSSCYHDISIGEKMDRKRRLLKTRLEKEFAEQGIDKDVKVDSLLVFSTPSGVRIHVHDQFKQENYCFRGSLFNRIDGFESVVEYTEEELEKLDFILEKIETEQKRFALTFDPEALKKSFAEAVVALTFDPAEEKVINIDTEEKKVINKNKTTFVTWLRRISGPVVAASFIAASGVALGASRIVK